MDEGKIFILAPFLIMTIILFNSSLSVFLPPATASIAQSLPQGIVITNIKASPIQPHIGDSLKINATILNNSTNTIFFYNGCQSPLSVTFDKNVITNKTVGCLALFNEVLPPGQSTTVVAPGTGISYIVTSYGPTNAQVTFLYHTFNETERPISNNFTFEMAGGSPVPEFPSVVETIFVLASIFAIFLIRFNNSQWRNQND